MTQLLSANYVMDQKWVLGSGEGITLRDPITERTLVRVDATNLPLEDAFHYARTIGFTELQKLTYATRAKYIKNSGESLI
jgi:3,4-dehydroadipyl-CoA semialdehyde dehydrogenase